MQEKKPSFEEAMSRLDEIVKLMEKGESTLEQSLSLFEEGTSLISACADMLDTAEQQVVKLRKGADGEPEELPFDIDE